MFFTYSRFRILTASVMVAFTSCAYASNNTADVKDSASNTQGVIQKKSRYTPQEREQEQLRRMDVIEHANTVFSLLGGEVALQKGNAGTALATYMVLLNRTKDPEIAERALEMAVSLNAYEQAELIYQKWREIEPVAGEAQKRMGWVRDVLRGNTDQALKGFDDVLVHATPEQTRRNFLLLAQAAVQQPNMAKKAASEVHKAALKYPQMPEAAIADTIFSVQAGNERYAVSALQTLANLDTEILPPTALVLRLIAQRNPAILSQFFQENDTKNLSPVWQELEISNLIAIKQPDKAYERLQVLLADNPNADLYIQAAFLASSRQENMATVNTYLEKAYNIGTNEQKSRAAVIGAIRYTDVKSYDSALSWVNKITAPDYIFDKTVLKATIEAEKGNFKNALAEVRQAKKLPEQQGRFFGQAELQRVYLFSLAKQGNSKEALTELNNLVEKTAKQANAAERLAEILYQRAMLYADELHQYDKAIADLRRCIELNPNSANSMNALGYTMLIAHTANVEEALKWIQAAYAQDPDSAAINDSMGWAYYIKGDAQAALPYLQYAFEKYPDAEVASHLGEVLWKLGEQEQAKKIWKAGLSKEGKTESLRKVMKRFGVTQ